MGDHKKGQGRIGLALINDVFLSNRMLHERLSVAAEINFLNCSDDQLCPHLADHLPEGLRHLIGAAGILFVQF